MAPPEPRQIKKPRLWLSCAVCRRRKVRCGREQPECANCVRMNETCVYKTMVRDEFTGKVQGTSPAPQYRDRDSHGLDPHNNNRSNGQPTDLTWFHWVAREAGNVTGPNDEAPGAREERTGRDDSSTLPANIRRAPSAQRRLSVDLAYPKVPGEETIQVPGGHHAPDPERSGANRDPSPGQGGSLCCDYLSLRQGARARYIGRAFWGFVAGKESQSDNFLDENCHVYPNLPLPHISSMGMFNLLRSLPTKPVSDALLDAFFFAVWPLCPIAHSPTLRADYVEFWDWCRNCGNAMPSEKLRDDPTFICLLFGVLYCGASAAPAASWTCDILQGLRKQTTVDQLKSAYTTSLSLCQHLEHPTSNTLLSTLLTGPFLDRPHEPMHNLISVSTTVRVAQSMGLHREGTWSALSLVDREIRRRAWWHIVWLDVQSSISTGLPPCCGSEALEAVRMVTHTRDEDISNPSPCRSPGADSMVSEQSLALLFAVERFQAARLQSKIVACLQSGQRLTNEGFGELVTAAKQLQLNIDTLIARIPAYGSLEKGLIPSRLDNASPSTDPSLYKHDASQPTVFAAWAQIMLTLLKSEITILLQKPFLPSPDSTSSQSCKSWVSMAQLCVNYLRNFLPLYQAPEFSPYVWFCRSNYGSLQCVFLALIYLHHFPDSEEVVQARYYVDEVIKHTMSLYQDSDPSSMRSSPEGPESDGGPSKPRMPLAIQVLVDIHSRFNSSSKPHNQPAPPLDEMEYQFHSCAPYLSSDSGFDQDLLSKILDLEA